MNEERDVSFAWTRESPHDPSLNCFQTIQMLVKCETRGSQHAPFFGHLCFSRGVFSAVLAEHSHAQVNWHCFDAALFEGYPRLSFLL